MILQRAIKYISPIQFSISFKMSVVNTSSGKIEGCRDVSSGGCSFMAFKGIPYAEPPVGSLRFADPVKVQSWSGVKEAKKYGQTCIQFDSFSRKLIGSEDCLYLNIFTRAEKYDEKLPVLVWIHGGGHNYGSGDDTEYGPLHAMDEEWVFITINYRVGAFGYPAPLNGLVPVNLGLKDQRLALEWIKDNVKSFGGDPNNITLMGESAGASAVWHQYLHSTTDTGDLFHKLIMQSGSPLAPWSSHTVEKANAEMIDFLKQVLHCEELPKDEELKKKLLEIPEKDFAEFNTRFNSTLIPYFSIVADDNLEGGKDFVNKSPLKDLEISRTKNVPTIISLNRDEGAFITAVSHTMGKPGLPLKEDK